MIPVRMQLSGFLSYRDSVEIPFNSFQLACISGQNGAGKSSILDGITWALFGKARGGDEEIINSHSKAAEVVFDFDYEGNLYRVQRSKPRGKTSILEFFIQDTAGGWNPLTESSMRATEERIQKILRLDYETFINASFFLQGKADQFAQQTAGNRKKILTSVLGLEIWETYRNLTAKNIREKEQTRNYLTGQLQGFEDEIAREHEYQQNLNQLQKDLASLEELLKGKTSELEAAVQLENSLNILKKSVDEKTTRLRAEQQKLEEQHTRLKQRETERDTYKSVLANAEEIENKYHAWLEDRRQAEEWESRAAAMRKVTDSRNIQKAIIDTRRASLETELRSLQARRKEVAAFESTLPGVEQTLARLREETLQLDNQRQARAELNGKLNLLQLEAAEMDVNYQALASQLESLTERISRLDEAQEEVCPVCKKPLTASERQRMIEDLRSDQAELEEKRKDFSERIQFSRNQIKGMSSQLDTLADLDLRIQQSQQRITREESRLEQIQEAVKSFTNAHLPRMVELETALQTEDFEPEARKELLKLTAEAEAIGYNHQEHTRVRQAEQRGKDSEAAMRNVDKARAALAPLEREIDTILESIAIEEQALRHLDEEKHTADQEYQALAARMPQKSVLEREVLTLKEQTNRKRLEVGGAENKIANLANVRKQQTDIQEKQNEILRQISRLKDLERAFSKDGVPALLIEQALPEIETQANDLLERLSNGSMSLKFETQTDYKNAKRSDKKETLEIKISDSTGTYREYEMYSGGEAFRVNFAIRLALSRVLAHRAGARLQTLVIDEGFGSQDTDGRQRLIEAINLVRSDFEKILVITHLEELKDAFPARIEVEKTATGSTVQVLVA